MGRRGSREPAPDVLGPVSSAEEATAPAATPNGPMTLACGVIGTRRTDAGVYETPEGADEGRRMRRAFLAAAMLVVVVGGAGILLTALLT